MTTREGAAPALIRLLLVEGRGLETFLKRTMRYLTRARSVRKSRTSKIVPVAPGHFERMFPAMKSCLTVCALFLLTYSFLAAQGAPGMGGEQAGQGRPPSGQGGGSSQGSGSFPGAKAADSSDQGSQGGKGGREQQPPKNIQSLSDVDLTKIVGGATMPLNLVIAATIIVNFLALKYQNAFAKFDELLREYRSDGKNEPDIQDKLRHTFARLRAIRRASSLVVWAIITFVATVFITMIGTLFPEESAFKALVLLGTTSGFVLVVLGLIGEYLETRLAHRGLQDDVKKIPEVFGGGASAP